MRYSSSAERLAVWRTEWRRARDRAESLVVVCVVYGKVVFVWDFDCLIFANPFDCLTFAAPQAWLSALLGSKKIRKIS